VPVLMRATRITELTINVQHPTLNIQWIWN
jgi:hypothetical protein